MNDIYYDVEVICRKCGLEFNGTFEGPDSYTSRYNLCSDCYEDATEEELKEYDNWA